MSRATGVEGPSSYKSFSEARACLVSDFGTFFFVTIDGVLGTFLSSVSAVEALVLSLDRPLLVPVAVETVDGVGGGGIDSLSTGSRCPS
jgi:hypothetical protein